jgi:hypothetical protein
MISFFSSGFVLTNHDELLVCGQIRSATKKGLVSFQTKKKGWSHLHAPGTQHPMLLQTAMPLRPSAALPPLLSFSDFLVSFEIQTTSSLFRRMFR